MRLHSSSVRPAELTRNPRSHNVRENSEISGRNSCSVFSLPNRKRMSRSEYGKSIRRPYPPSAIRQSPADSRLCTRNTSSKIWRTWWSANSQSAWSVSRALVPDSNPWRIFCRSASACGPSTDNGVGDSCMFLEGGTPAFNPGRAAVVTFSRLAARFPFARRLGTNTNT